MLNKKEWKVLFLASLGGMLEFYDFIIYALFAGSISLAFFPKSDEMTALLKTFAIFSLGYLVRPLGGMIFGHFGDRFGRKKVFSISVLLMAISTLAIAFVPGFSSWGIWAAIVLVTFRVIQGMSIGGEIPGAITLVSEIMPRRRGFACGMVLFAVIIGIVIGSLVHLCLKDLIANGMIPDWGWRIAFIIGGVFGFVSYYLRRELYESPLFIQLESSVVHLPALVLFRQHLRSVVSGWCIYAAVSVSVVLLFVFGPAYLVKVLHYNDIAVYWQNTVAILIVALVCIGSGMLGDLRVRRMVAFLLVVSIILLALPLYQGLINHDLSLVWRMLLPIWIMAGITGIAPALLVDLFPTQIRYSGIGLVYNLGFATFGGLAPVIVMALIKKTNDPMMAAYFLIAASVVSLIGILLMPRKSYFEDYQ